MEKLQPNTLQYNWRSIYYATERCSDQVVIDIQETGNIANCENIGTAVGM